MEPEIKNQKITLSLKDHKPEHGDVDIVWFSKNQRVWRALKAWMIFWAIGAACIFVPILHFVLVPTMIVLGPLVGLIKGSQKAEIVKLRGYCPACQTPQQMKAQKPSWPLILICSSCGHDLKLAPIGTEQPQQETQFQV